jgi:hypothetical protein
MSSSPETAKLEKEPSGGVKRNARMAYADGLMEAPEAGLAKDAPAEELYRIGLIYSAGMGVTADPMAAHKWFNLAVARGHGPARVNREEMAEMLTPQEVVQAQKSAREWLTRPN